MAPSHGRAHRGCLKADRLPGECGTRKPEHDEIVIRYCDCEDAQRLPFFVIERCGDENCKTFQAAAL